MQRRQFLLSMSSASFVAMVGHVVPTLAASSPQRYLSTDDGRVLYTADAAEGMENWQESIKFGEDFKIIQLIQNKNVAEVQVEFNGRQFWLLSSDGRRWKPYYSRLLSRLIHKPI